MDDSLSGEAGMGSDEEPELGSGPLDRVIAWIRRINRWMHWVAGTTIVGLMFLTVIDIVGRRFFNRPFPGTVELTQLAMVVAIYLGFAFAQDQGDHISVDVVYTRLRRTVKLALTAITSLFSIVVIALLGWRLYVFAGVLEQGGYTTATRGIPEFPFSLVAVVGSVLFVAALTSSAVLAMRKFRETTS